MKGKAKPVDSLTVEDLKKHPVWAYSLDEGDSGPGETAVRPIKNIPVASLSGKVVGTEVLLANGLRVWALVGNVDPANARLTAHFLTLSVEFGGLWFHLARYHDFDYDERGPAAIAKFLGLTVNDVFPISYDIRAYARGEEASLRGKIPAEPGERLSQDELVALAIP